MKAFFWKHLRSLLGAVVLLIGVHGTSQAGDEICSQNGGSSVCVKSTLWFTVHNKPDTFSTGKAACASHNYTGYNYKLINGTWRTKGHEHAPACFYDSCEFASAAGETEPRWHCQNGARQGWATPNQQCPQLNGQHATGGWYDSADDSEVPGGRLWCGYTLPVEEECCPVGNPVLPGTGTRINRETDYQGSGAEPLLIQRYYRSQWADGLNGGMNPSPDLGPGWKLSVHAQISKIRPGERRTSTLHVLRPDGRIQVFYGSGNPRIWKSNSNRDSLTELSTGWRIKNFADDSVENYNTAGKLISTVARNGATTKLAYDAAGRISTVTNSFGRKLTFTYDSNGRPLTLVAPGGETTTYGYDASGNLATVAWPGGAQRRYHYEDARYPGALTGVTDEMGVRIGTYEYDNNGRIAATQRANGTERITFTYAADGQGRPSSQVTTPNSYLNYTFQDSGGVRRPIAVSTTANGDPNVGNISAATVYAGSQNEPTKQVALDGTTTFTAYDSKGRPTERATFPASFQTATTRPALANATRVVSTQWHATWNLPLQQAEPNRITAYTYDSKGNLTGLSTSATTDNTGAAKFTAVKTGPTTATGWGYDAKSLNTSVVETVGGVETGRWLLTYNTLGDVTSIKDVPRNRTATMTQYDAHGRMLTGTTDLGTSLALTYSPRGDITREARNGQSVDFTYNPVGNLLKVRTPNGQTIDYVLDANQKLIDVKLNGVSITPQMLAQAEYPDTPLKAQITTAKKWLALGLSALIRDAHAQVVVIDLGGSKRPQFDPRNDMLMVPMSDADKALRALQEAITRACTCDPSNGYSKPTFTAKSFAHAFWGGHTMPMFSDQSYFVEKVGQALVDEVIARASIPPGRIEQQGSREVYHAPMSRDIGMAPQSQLPGSPLGTTRWVRLVVEKNNCAGRWRFNEVVTIFPEERP
jgi:YD repeat-containing protein